VPARGLGMLGSSVGGALRKVGGKGQGGQGQRGWTRSQQPVGGRADKNRLNNQPPGGEASALSRRQPGLSRVGESCWGSVVSIGASIVDGCGVLVVLTMNWIENSDSGWREWHGRRQRVERLERRQ